MSKFRRTWGCATSSIKVQHRLGVLGRTFVGFEGKGHSVLARCVAEPPQMVDDRPPLGSVCRLAGARDADLGGEPAPGELNPPSRQLKSIASANVGASDIAAADFDRMALEMVAEGPRGGIVGLLGDHDRLRYHQAARSCARAVPARGDSRPASLIRSAAVQTPADP